MTIFPHTIDSTMLACFRSCPRKYYLQYLQHWKPKQESVHLIAGGAFASAVEAARRAYFIDKLSREEAEAAGLLKLIEKYGDFECPASSSKSCERMCGALEFYLDQYPLGGDGVTPLEDGQGNVIGVEMSFAEPTDFIHPTSGDPILYTGRSDLIGHFAGGKFVFDEKTTSQLGASWTRQWELRSQFTGYCWAAGRAGMLVAGVIVRGVSILKTKYDTAQVITYRPQPEIDRWYTQLMHDLARIQRCYEEDYWDYNLDHACNEYGNCAFYQVCKSQTPEIWLETYFEKRVWDPMLRATISVEDYKKQWGGE